MKSHRLPSQSVNILRSRNWTESLSFKCDDQCCFRSHSFFLSLVSNIVLFLLCALSKDALQLRENMRSDNISLTITINIFGPGTNGVTRVLRRKTDIILQINNLLREIFSICSNLVHFTSLRMYTSIWSASLIERALKFLTVTRWEYIKWNFPWFECRRNQIWYEM